MKNLRTIGISLFLLLTSFIGVFGQGRVSPPPVSSGFTPAGSALGNYPLDGFAKVNEFSGQMDFTLQLGETFGRGDTSLPLNFNIRSRESRVRHLDFSPPYVQTTFPDYHSYNIDYSEHGNVKLPDFSPGIIVARRSGDLKYTTPPPGSGSSGSIRLCATLSRLTFMSSSGSVELRDRQTNGRPYGIGGAYGTYWLDDNYPPLNRGRIFDSKDGSQMTFVSDTDIVDVNCPALTNEIQPQWLSGTLYFPNGLQYRFDNGNVTSIIDRNGNKTLGNDTIDRGTRITSNQSDPSEPYQVTLTKKGVGGQVDRITKIYYRPVIESMRADQQARDGRALFPSIYQCATSNGCNVGGGETSNHRTKPYLIELPNNQTYRFFYNSYGELARVELPTGGAYEYDWNGQFGAYSTVGEVCISTNNCSNYLKDWAIARRVVKQRTYNTNNALESETSYEMNFPDFTQSNLEIKTISGTGELLSHSKVYFHGKPLDALHNSKGAVTYDSPYAGQQFKREIYNSAGQIIQTIENIYEVTGSTPLYPGSPERIPEQTLTKETKITLNERNLVSKQTFNYDQSGNKTDVFEYEHGFGNSGSFLRRTHTDFVTDSNYHDANLKGLPSQSWISSDVNGNNKVSLTQIEYDNYAENPLVSRSNVIGHDTANFDTNRTIRGNATKVTTFTDASTQSGGVNTRSHYDILGNVVTTVDALGNATQIDYSDRFGSPDNEARSNSAPTQLNGLQTLAFPTRITNVLGWAVHTQFDYWTGVPVNNENINGIINKTIYNDPLNRVTQTVTAVNTPFEMQSSITHDDYNRRIESKSDLFALNDNLAKSESFYDGLGRTIEARKYEADGGYVATKSIPFLMIQDPETSIWRAGTKLSNPYRPLKNEQPVWTMALSDALRREIKTITPDGATVKTEYNGNATTVADQAGKQRRSLTNGLGQLVRVDEPNAAGQLGDISSPNQSTVYEYDTLSNLTRVVQGDQQRTFVYNSLSRLTSATNPELGTTVNGVHTPGTILYSYDSNGNLTRKTDARNIKTLYNYDSLSRVTKRCYVNADSTAPADNDCGALTGGQMLIDSPTVSYLYDNLPNAKSKLIKVSSAVSTTEYTAFDNLGRITASAQATGGDTDAPAGGRVFGYEYNLSGALIKQMLPSGRVVRTELDADGALSRVTTQKNSNTGQRLAASIFSYTAAGAVAAMRLGNGRWENTAFNSRLQPVQMGLGNGATDASAWKVNFDYGTGAQAGQNNGNILKQTITVPGATVNNTAHAGFTAIQNYSYDELNRLQSAAENVTADGQTTGAQTWQQTFVFDRFGNRWFATGGGQTTTPALNSTDPLQAPKVVNPEIDQTTNRLKTEQYSEANVYLFDAAGNMTRDALGRQFIYDGENKQKEVKSASNQTVGTYFYDGDGKRVKKIDGNTGEVTIFVYDAGGRLSAEYSNNAANNDSPQTSYLTNDHLGSPRVITDAVGKVTSRRDFLPFGEDVATPQRTANLSYLADDVKQKFTGYEKDTETGLDFAQARMYSGNHGRFTSPDPIKMTKERLLDPQRINLYAYVRNNPLKFVDPSGLDLVVAAKNQKEAQNTFRIYQLGLRKEDRKYSQLVIGNGKNGFAKGEFGVTVDKNHKSKSENFQAAQTIANDKQRTEIRITGKNEDIAPGKSIGVKQGNNLVTQPLGAYLTSQGSNPPTFVLKQAEGGGGTFFPSNTKIVEGNFYTSSKSIEVFVHSDGTDADKAATMHHELRHDSKSDMGRNLPNGLHLDDPSMDGPNGEAKRAEREAIRNARRP